jgi:hypothetical protein
MTRITTALLLSATLFAGSANAAVLTFFGEDTGANGAFVPGGASETARNNFLANLDGVGTEDFEGFANGTTTPIALTFPGSAGSITATLNDPSGSAFTSTNPGAGRFATSGVSFLQEVTNGFRIDFSSPIAAFGFYGTDIGDFKGQITLTFTNGSTLNLTVPNTLNGPNASLLFFGVIDTVNSYTSVTFGNTNAGTDFFGFDDLIIGDIDQVDPVPAPAALVLFGLGLAGLGFARRR